MAEFLFVGKAPIRVWRSSVNPFVIKKGDTVPTLFGQIIDEDGEPVSLAALTTIKLAWWPVGNEAGITRAAATVYGAPADGYCFYTFTALQTATAGKYLAQWEVVYASGAVMKVPSNSFISIEVLAAPVP